MRIWDRIVLAAPTCTLWIRDDISRVWRFRFCERFWVSDLDMFIAGLGLSGWTTRTTTTTGSKRI